jgi:hypothetical protein
MKLKSKIKALTKNRNIIIKNRSTVINSINKVRIYSKTIIKRDFIKTY